MEKIRILWADDEIDMLKPHVIFLEHKGYDVTTINNGSDALELIHRYDFDIVFLDENMPGLSGIETLEKIKHDYPGLPVVMITKSEEESIMEDAIGSNIADYLIKPVKPNQILLSLKRNLENKKLVSEKTTLGYQQDFRNIGLEIGSHLNHHEWTEIYRKLVRWEIDLEKSKDEGIMQVLNMQQDEANAVFGRFIEKNYIDWVNGRSADKPVLSHTVVREKILPRLDTTDKPLFVLLIDNLRYDHWKAIQPLLEDYYRIESDEMYCSILPTTTQYARNAFFAGLMPSEIRKKYPKYWTDEEDDGTKNQFESELLGEQLKRFGKDVRFSYNKVLNLNAGKKLVETLPNLLGNKLNVIVYNFVDMLSHARTEMEMIRELAEDEAAYRSLVVSWFEHSSLYEIVRFVAQKKCELMITTDHGSIKVKNPVRLLGDREVNTNLRYKYGRNLNYNHKEAFEVRDPESVFLPRMNVSTTFVFARPGDFFAYPNNFNYYVNYYRNTFQHGGISMQEMLIPIIYLKPK
jgi:DNA-binding response OmpR family regulator